MYALINKKYTIMKERFSIETTFYLLNKKIDAFLIKKLVCMKTNYSDS